MCTAEKEEEVSRIKFINKLKTDATKVSFEETIAVIDANYSFTPTTFSNGNQINQARENNGSCKIFSFANSNNLSSSNPQNS